MAMNIDDLIKSPGEWLGSGGPLSDVVVSSRVRLARNLLGHHFLTRADETERRDIVAELNEAINAADFGKETFYVNIPDADPLDRKILVERHLISRQHAEGEGSRGVAISKVETLSLMINEEDHLRIQVLRRGMNLDEAWKEMTTVDEALEGLVKYSFDKQYGYLTACPTNVGTGLRVSVMLHLPALKLTNEIEKFFRAAKDMQLAVRGFFGEGTEATGDFYQVSNQTTLGKSEDEILEGFKTHVIPSIVKYEQEARRVLSQDRPAALDDKCWRALGLLENARAISSEEALVLLSHLRLGVVMGRIGHLDLESVNDLFIAIQSAHLQKREQRLLDGENRSIVRAEYIRGCLGRHRPSEN